MSSMLLVATSRNLSDLMSYSFSSSFIVKTLDVLLTRGSTIKVKKEPIYDLVKEF